MKSKETKKNYLSTKFTKLYKPILFINISSLPLFGKDKYLVCFKANAPNSNTFDKI